MHKIALLGVGPGQPGLLSVDACDRLARAEVVLFNPSIAESCWRAKVPSTAICETIDEATPDEEDRARALLLTLAHEGRRVVRMRAWDGWRTPEALRDALALRTAGISFEIVPGIEASGADWEAWLRGHPLHGRRIVVTRMREQASGTAEALRERGADPWVMPTIELQPPPDPEAFHAALQALRSFDLVAFTSANSVEQTFDKLGAMGKDAREFGSCLVAAIGTATARALGDRGIRADVVAKEFRGEQLATAILERMAGRASRRVLLPRAMEAREVLPEMLRDAGCEVSVVHAYRTGLPSPELISSFRASLEAGRVDAVLLTSSSTVKNLCEMLGTGYVEVLGHTVLASIGPITSETARQLGLQVGVEAKQYTIPGLIDALEARFAL